MFLGFSGALHVLKSTVNKMVNNKVQDKTTAARQEDIKNTTCNKNNNRGECGGVNTVKTVKYCLQSTSDTRVVV